VARATVDEFLPGFLAFGVPLCVMYIAIDAKPGNRYSLFRWGVKKFCTFLFPATQHNLLRPEGDGPETFPAVNEDWSGMQSLDPSRPGWKRLFPADLVVESGHRHYADDVVRVRLVAAVDDVAVVNSMRSGKRQASAVHGDAIEGSFFARWLATETASLG
jgi:hypothetical protein